MIGRPSLTETAFLVGAGVSIDAPSCIPAARPIIARIFQWLAAGDDHLAGRLTARSEPGSAFCPFDFLRFEAVLEAVSRETPQIIRLLHVLETWGSPNLTTNFDTRLEMAAAWSGNEAPLFLLSPRQNVPPPDARIVKLHGSFPDFQRGGSHLPRGTLTQIGAIGLAFEHLPGFVAWFEAMSRGRTLVVMGYSASDSFDVMPLIKDRWAGDQVIWFDYMPGARRVRATEVADGEFSMCYDQGDHSGMKRARGKLRKVARKAGSIWGMVLWHLFTACELGVRLRAGVSDDRHENYCRRVLPAAAIHALTARSAAAASTAWRRLILSAQRRQPTAKR